MTEPEKRTLALHPAITFALRFSFAVAGGLLIFHIIPGFYVELDRKSITFSHSTTLTPVILVFFGLVAIGISLARWRARTLNSRRNEIPPQAPN